MTERSGKASTSRTRRDTSINIRVPTAMRDLIDSAADALGTTRSDFILESARKHAIDVLLDRRFFALDANRYAAFVRALDAPAAPNAKLRKLLSSKSPWEN
jgi:uncharacterized protein (DUF1778 family)